MAENKEEQEQVNNQQATDTNDDSATNNEQLEGENGDTDAETEIEVDPISALENQLAEAKDKYLRLYADFENFRRRTSKEKIEMIQNASESLIKERIPVIDDFERANKSFEKSRKNDE